MDVALLIVQAILVVKCVLAAFSHALQHNKPEMRDSIVKMGVGARLVLFPAALFLLLGSLGLALPVFIHTLEWLTPYAAAGLGLLLLASIPMHLQSRDNPKIYVGLVLAALAAFVAYGRWVLVP